MFSSTMLAMSNADVSAEGAQICPSCRSDVPPRVAVCPQCGVDLAMAAVLMERVALSVIPASPNIPFVGDAILSKFGEFLTKKNYISAAQLDAGLARQRVIAATGLRQTLGQVLLDMRVLTREHLERASVEQVQELQNALRQANTQLEERVAERTRELQAAYQQLTELDKLKGNFLNNISHELRTPLTKIKGFCLLMAAGDLGPLTDDQVQALQTMNRGVGELERLVGDLIQYGTGARGEMKLKPGPCAVADIVAQSVRAAEEKARQRGVALAISAPDDLPVVAADVEKIRWVVTQLLDNALKFTPAGGRVEAGAAEQGEGVRVYVQDTGEGIAADKRKELFQAFHQLDGSTTRRQGGTGLGLALVRMIVEAHRSAIHVDSAPGHGSRFWFDLLPASRPR